MSRSQTQVREALEVLLDPVSYAGRYGDQIPKGMDPLTHFLAVGRLRRFDPNLLFDGRWYCAQHSLQGVEDPYTHFIAAGERRGLAPGPYFDPTWYRRMNPDVEAAGVNSLVHYVEYGWSEGRLPSPMFDPTLPQSAPLRIWPLDAEASMDPSEVLRLAPRPSSLAAILSAQEPTSFLDPSAVLQIAVETRPSLRSHQSRVHVIGGMRGVLHDEGAGMLSIPDVGAGWALLHVTHAIAPPIAAAVHLLGVTSLNDEAELERWSVRLQRAVSGIASPCLLIDEALPAGVEARLLAASRATSAFRAPKRRLLAVEQLIMLDA